MTDIASDMHPHSPIRATLSPSTRLLAATVAFACLAALGVAAFLRPDPRGIGTHRQLGLAACQFHARTGIPCPTCGVTTSFAHLARGQIFASLYVQPLGTVLGLACIVAFWLAAHMAVSGRAAPGLLRRFSAGWWITAAMALVILAWMWKILIRVGGIDGTA